MASSDGFRWKAADPKWFFAVESAVKSLPIQLLLSMGLLYFPAGKISVNKGTFELTKSNIVLGRSGTVALKSPSHGELRWKALKNKIFQATSTTSAVNSPSHGELRWIWQKCRWSQVVFRSWIGCWKPADPTASIDRFFFLLGRLTLTKAHAN